MARTPDELESPSCLPAGRPASKSAGRPLPTLYRGEKTALSRRPSSQPVKFELIRTIQLSHLGRKRSRFPWERGRLACFRSGRDARAPKHMPSQSRKLNDPAHGQFPCLVSDCCLLFFPLTGTYHTNRNLTKCTVLWCVRQPPVRWPNALPLRGVNGVSVPCRGESGANLA
jgi:hypothetical protein